MRLLLVPVLVLPSPVALRLLIGDNLRALELSDGLRERVHLRRGDAMHAELRGGARRVRAHQKNRSVPAPVPGESLWARTWNVKRNSSSPMPGSGELESKRMLYRVPQRMAFAFGFWASVSELQVTAPPASVCAQGVLL